MPRGRREEYAGENVWLEANITKLMHCVLKGELWSPEMEVDPGPSPVFLKKKEVIRRTGYSHQTIWKLENMGRFPRHVHLPGAATVKRFASAQQAAAGET